MFTEKGTLPIGIEYDGKIHRDFELRPQTVADSVDAVEEDRARDNESYLGVVVLAKQMIKLGDIPREDITTNLLLGMYDVDIAAVNEALGRLRKRLLSFRDEPKNSA